MVVALLNGPEASEEEVFSRTSCREAWVNRLVLEHQGLSPAMLNPKEQTAKDQCMGKLEV